MSKLLKLLVATGAMAILMALGANAAFAQNGGGGGGGGGGSNACPEPTPGFPDMPTPGCGHVRGDGTCEDGIDNDDDGRKDRGDSECRDPNDGCENGAPGCPDGGNGDNGDECPPATGSISGVVQQVSDGIRDEDGAALADVIDQVNCGVVVPLEEALGLGGEEMGL